MNILYKLAAAGLLSACAVSQANAVVVSFATDASFSNITNCSSNAANCSITNGGDRLNMSGSSNQSFMVITDSSGSVNTNTNDTVLTKIVWTNNATSNADQNFNVVYSIKLTFTAPSAQNDTQTFNLNITQPTNPPGDNVFSISNATLQGLGPFTLAGVIVSDLKFTLSGAGAYDGTNWSNPEGGVSTLTVSADFTAAVPEPSTWAMMLLGFGGLAFATMRRRRPALAA